MAQLGFTVNTEDLPDAQDFSPLPANNYSVMIVKSEVVPTNKTKELMKTAGLTDLDAYRKVNSAAEIMLKIEMDVQDDGPYKNRKIYHNFNLVNESAKAVEISQGQIKQLAKEALKMASFSDSTELHNKRFVVELAQDRGKDYVKDGQKVEGKIQNVVKKFLPWAGQSTAPAKTGSAGPWGQKQ